MIKTQFDNLITQNPMLIEITRFRRRFLSFAGPNQVNAAVFALVLICYAGIIMAVVSGKGEIPPVSLIMFQTLLFAFFAPAMLHNAIAGEREKRTWDLLLVAPISKAQIVAGKFIGAVSALGIGAAFFLAPIAISAMTYKKSTFGEIFEADLISLSFGVFCCALTLFFSARVKRGFMALAVTLGVLIIAFGAFPALISVLFMGSSADQNVIMYLHPGMPLARILQIGAMRGNAWDMSNSDLAISSVYMGVPHILTYLGLSAVALGWTENTLQFPENDVKFLPKGRDNA